MKASLIVLVLVGLLTGYQPKTFQPPYLGAALIVAATASLHQLSIFR